MNLEPFIRFSDRLVEPILLLTGRGDVLACNRATHSAVSVDLVGKNLCAHVADEAALRRYLRLATRSATPLPGAIAFSSDASRWRCDAGAMTAAQSVLVVLQLRPANDAVRRFLTLNQQIEKLHAEIRRRVQLEREREDLLEKERVARAQAEEASRLKDELLAAVSHELRTPLHAISGWLELIQGSLDDRPLVERGLGIIARNVAAETQLIEDLVDMSLAFTGRMRLDVRPVDLEQLVKDVVESVGPALQAKEQRLEVIAAVGTCVVQGDATRLRQVVWNLVMNASKYTPKRGKVQVVLRRVNSHVEVVVSDTGDGIAPELLPYIFDRFRRADGGSTRRSGGLGLGLAIVRHLVELHGGLVLAHSEGAGKGSTFVVTLPLPLFRNEPMPRDAAAVERGHELRGIHVLLVEDHDDSREFLPAILASRGATLTTVARASEALAAFAANPPSILLSDIEMPEEDGFTLVRKLRDLETKLARPPVPAIAVSAHAISEVRLHALRAGYQSFVSKPVNPSELIAMVASLCRSR